MSVSTTEILDAQSRETAEIQLVIFSLAGCELAVEIHEVREIIRVSDITLMPKAPKYLEGIINLRGRIFPVLDLKKRFEMPLVDRTLETRILVVEKQDQMVGLLVDKVVEVLKAPPSSIGAPDQPVLNIGVDFMKGLWTFRERLIILFNLEKVFNFEGLRIVPDMETGTSK